MKTNKRLILGVRLQEKYKKLWAEYLVKYIREYKKEGIEIKYMTIQNLSLIHILDLESKKEIFVIRPSKTIKKLKE